MEQHVARRGGGLMNAADGFERVKILGHWSAEKPRPCVCANSRYAGEASIGNAKAYAANQRRHVPEQLADLRAVGKSLIQCRDKENRGTGQHCRDGLRILQGSQIFFTKC